MANKVDVVSKAQIVDAVANNCSVSKTLVAKVLDSFFGEVADNLVKGNKVALTGFMSFSVVERKKRIGINPQSKKRVEYPAKKVVKAKLGKKLKDFEAMKKNRRK